MVSVAVTGHRGLSPSVGELVSETIRSELARQDPDQLVGISCLADGADQIFAQAVLDLGGRLEVVVPAAKYRDGLPPEAWTTYDRLISAATAVHRLEHIESTAESHMDASAYMLRDADLLFAVWDGEPARGFGGTADVVTHARSIGLPVTVIWPIGATRD